MQAPSNLTMNFLRINKDLVLANLRADEMPPIMLELNVPLSFYQSEYFHNHREDMIQYLAQQARRFRLKRATLHLAVAFVDRILSLIPTTIEDNLGLVSTTALCIAAKFEESHNKAPHLERIAASSQLNPQDIRDCEVRLLNSIGWAINNITTQLWIDVYSSIGLFRPDETRDGEALDENAISHLKRQVNIFSSLSLFVIQAQRQVPSLVAAACVLCARLVAALDNPWSDHLFALTQFQHLDLEAVCISLFQIASHSFPEDLSLYLNLINFLIQWPSDEEMSTEDEDNPGDQGQEINDNVDDEHVDEHGDDSDVDEEDEKHQVAEFDCNPDRVTSPGFISEQRNNSN